MLGGWWLFLFLCYVAGALALNLPHRDEIKLVES